MKIGIDIMGGDFSPDEIVKGAVLAMDEKPHLKLVLLGDEKKAKQIISENNGDASLFEFVNTTQVIGMGEHPAKAFSRKPDSSIARGFNLLNNKKIAAFASVGNTGAMLVGAMLTVKSIPGIIRPAIAAVIPQKFGNNGTILDVGLNPDCKPDVLYQYGIIGSIYSHEVLGIKNPKVGLLNIGSEAEKGNLLAKAAFEAMRGTKDFNFIGNIEPADTFLSNKVDVVICDGFTGNVILKQMEAFYWILREQNYQNDFFEKLNYENVGGTPILGVNSNVLIGHGASKAKAVKAMIYQSENICNAKLSQKIKDFFK